ncbi:Transcription-repair-coupling factor [gut metagenome]|uniref:Transcription-repair-coupling factor n=1 Tax=gut metagenome TaxID=749906 RepID=J9FY22_9ZZZZ
MVTPQKQLTEQASKRLKSIKEFTQLGSGYKIAMRDLTIRGAGDMLGPKQAGFVDSVGLDMYLDLLTQAVARKKKLAQMANPDLKIIDESKEEEVPEIKQTNIQMEGYVPVPFTSSDGDKLALYQAIRDIRSKEQLEQYEKRTADIFGRIPKEVQQLFNKRRMDLFASQDGVELVQEKDHRIEIRMTPEWSRKADGLKLFEAMSAVSRQINMTLKNGAIVVSFEKKKHYWDLFIKVTEVLNDPLFRKE